MKSEQKQGGTLTTASSMHASLADLGVMRIAGADAVSFLQGQLSNDVAQVTTHRGVLAGYHNPQGRAIALLRLIQTGAGDLLAVLPRELIPDVIGRLRKFVLRAKVTLHDESLAWQVSGVRGPTDEIDASRSILIPLDTSPARWLLLSASGSAVGSTPSRDEWTALDISEGIPQVYKETTEAFVAQMLNLDVLNGIAFDKGCYTGQEVIARAHYRGRVKRRMQRFRSNAPTTLARGANARLSDGRSIKVVEVVTLADGRCEFLAVAPLASGSVEDEQAQSGESPLDAEQLPMPYAFPE
jgi:tRNA-modifying protein YgfZ